MEWNKNFGTGIASIDAQHKGLIQLLSRLQSSINSDESQKEYGNTLRALVEYTRYHFTNEESFMASISYPKLEEQQKMHAKLISDVRNILLRLKHGKPIQAIQLMRFLNDWVSQHILNEDLQIGKYILNQQRRGTTLMHKAKSSIDEEIMANLQANIKLYEQKALTEEEYNSKCHEILYKKLEPENIQKIPELENAISFIESLCKEKHLSGENGLAIKKYIVKKSDISYILSQFSNTEARLCFLKELHDGTLLTTEDYNKWKEDLLKGD